MSDTPTVRTHAHRVTEASFIVGNEAAILGALEGRDREIEALRARVGWEVADKNEYADRLRDLATDLAPFGCRPTMDAVKVLDYARVAIFDLIRERDQLREELTIAENARDRLAADRTAALATALLDRALQAQHEPEGLHVVHAALVEALANAHTNGRPLEYADLAGLTGSPARLEGYDALLGELERTKRALNVAIGERGALQAIRAYLDAVVTQPGRDDFPEWHALADEDRDRLQAWGDRVCQAGMDAENEATEEAEDAARHAAEQADILLTTIRLALGDNPAGNGWKPPTGVHPVVDLALNVSEERDGAVAALATARLDGARVMQADAAGILDAEARRMQDAADALLAEDGDVTDIEKNHRLNSNAIMCRMAAGKIRAIDPAAVVGSPEPALAECPGCEGSGSVSPSGCIRCPACEGSGTVPAAVVGSGS